MADSKFRPGFRLSVLDVVILVVGIGAASAVPWLDLWLRTAIAFVVLHFFLFCNILRMSRSSELVWAAAFLALAAWALMANLTSWPVVFASSGGLTVLLAIIEIRRPSYHGVGWRLLNPGLPEWWQNHSPR